MLLLASAGGAGAQQSSTGDLSVAGHVGVEANVAPVCKLGPPSRPAIDLGQMSATSGPRVGRIATLPEQTITLPGSYCNFGGTKVTVRAEAMVQPDASALPEGFARAVNYSSTVTTWASTPPQVTTAASANGASPVAEGSGGTEPAAKLTDLTLALSAFTVPSDALLIAGTYQGQVTITLGPAATESSGQGE
jgi:hypothetical protein